MKEIEEKIEKLNALHKKIMNYKRKHPKERLGFALSTGGILNAYREGDITFKKAIKYLQIRDTIKCQ